MSQANVYNANISNATWYTDKVEIVTTSAPAIYNIYVMPAGPAANMVITGSVTSGSNILITTQALANLVNGAITGTGIPANTTVSSVNAEQNQLILSANASSSSATTQNYNVVLAAPGNMYNNAPIVAPNSRQQIYVGAGNKLNVTCTATFTARELGTASSATAGF